MTDIEKEALVLFRDKELWQLKEMRVEPNLTDRELDVIETALEFRRSYNRIKLNQKKLQTQK